MATNPHSRPSFSPYLKWGIGLHVIVLTLVVLSVLVMVNYLSRDYFLRFHLSTRTKIELFPRTVSLLRSLTNQVKVTLYYDTDDEFYRPVSDLLGEYNRVNKRITVRTVDYLHDPPGLAQAVKDKYNLSAPTDKNLVIFECEKKWIVRAGNDLASYVKEQVPNEKELEFRRRPSAFLGETVFTMALLDVTSAKPLKAYFLQDNEEHQINSGDELAGYLKFAAILHENYILAEPLSLLGTNAVPMDCNLLVIAGPSKTLLDPELKKIEQYLNQGGRLLALFNYAARNKDLGLEGILAKWGVDVGHNVIQDPARSSSGQDVVISQFSKHPLVNSLLGSRLSRLDLVLPRSVGQLKGRTQAADAPHVEELAFSGPSSFATDAPVHKRPFPLMVAVEKGAIRDVITERGSTRIVVAGDSIFLANHYIDALANRDFAACAVNWLLERTQLLDGLGPRPIEEHRFVMTKAQLHEAQWVLLAGLPGSVLVLGSLVWLRRRK